MENILVNFCSNLPTYSHYNCLFLPFFNYYFFLFRGCTLHGVLRKFELCFAYFFLKGNSPHFGLAIQELPFDFSWFQKLIQLILYIINKLNNFPPNFHHKSSCFWNMFIIIVASFCKFLFEVYDFLFIPC